jgi:hypothetical protein
MRKVALLLLLARWAAAEQPTVVDTARIAGAERALGIDPFAEAPLGDLLASAPASDLRRHYSASSATADRVVLDAE